jgi:hypothetical protein
MAKGTRRPTRLPNWSENGPKRLWSSDFCAAVHGAEVADFQGLGNAAEWSRTITGVSTHKALNLEVGGVFSSIQGSQVT